MNISTAIIKGMLIISKSREAMPMNRRFSHDIACFHWNLGDL